MELMMKREREREVYLRREHATHINQSIGRSNQVKSINK